MGSRPITDAEIDERLADALAEVAKLDDDEITLEVVAKAIRVAYAKGHLDGEARASARP